MPLTMGWTYLCGNHGPAHQETRTTSPLQQIRPALADIGDLGRQIQALMRAGWDQNEGLLLWTGVMVPQSKNISFFDHATPSNHPLTPIPG